MEQANRARSSARPARRTSAIELAIDGDGRVRSRDRHPVLRPHARVVREARPVRPAAPREGRPRGRPAPHRRGRRHRDRPGDPPGARQRRGHPPLRPALLPMAESKVEISRRRLEPSLPGLQGRARERPRRRLRRERSPRTSSTRSRRTRGSTCTSSSATGRARTTSVEAIFKGVARALRAGARARSARRRHPIGQGSLVEPCSRPPRSRSSTTAPATCAASRRRSSAPA